MKILYLGVYRDSTGWANAAINYILALDAAGVEVVPRPIKLNDKQAELPERLLELEGNDPYGADVCIQNILPHMFTYDGGFGANIGLFFTETSNFKYTSWAERCNMMDALMVPSIREFRAAKDSGVDKEIYICGMPSDTKKFDQEYEPFDIPEIKDTFVFYFIGEFSRRKNLAALLKAFHSEFDINEPVSLVIKAHLPNQDAKESQNVITNFCKEIKNGLKIQADGNYKKEIIISSFLTNHDIMRLHATCNCFVMPSYGESWCIPAFEAMGMGNVPILTSGTGMDDWGGEPEYGARYVEARDTPCFGMLETFGDIYTGHELCREISVCDLGQRMRDMYELEKPVVNDVYRDKSNAGRIQAKRYDYALVGQRMKNSIEQVLEHKNEEMVCA